MLARGAFVLALAAFSSTRALASSDSRRPGALIVMFREPAARALSRETTRASGSAGALRSGVRSLDLLHARFGVVAATNLALPESHGRAVARKLGLDRVFLLALSRSADLDAAARAYAADPEVVFAEPDRLYDYALPNDPLAPAHWGHRNTAQLPSWSPDPAPCGGRTGAPTGVSGFDAHMQDAWSGPAGFGRPEVVIAILDSGVDWGHPDLRIWRNPIEVENGLDDDGNGLIDDLRGWDFGSGTPGDADPSDRIGHGTACAGVAAAIADNAIGSAGAAGGCTILPLKVAPDLGSPSNSAILLALQYAANQGARVASMSFGSFIASSSVFLGCRYAAERGVVIFAATGNANRSVIFYPAAFQDVIAVGAASPCRERKRSGDDPNSIALCSGPTPPSVFRDAHGVSCDGEFAWGSSFGSTVRDDSAAVDLLGPTFLPTTDARGGLGFAIGDYLSDFAGTSCASPYVAGLCALALSANPGLTPAQARAALCLGAEDVTNVESPVGWDRYSGYGFARGAPPRAPGLGGLASVALLLALAGTAVALGIGTPARARIRGTSRDA